METRTPVAGPPGRPADAIAKSGQKTHGIPFSAVGTPFVEVERAHGTLMRPDKIVETGTLPQTRNELHIWVREHLHLPQASETALLNAIDAVFTRHERLWQESKHEAIQALSAGFADKMAHVKTELTAKEA